MKRTAAEAKKSLRKKLIRLAYEHPEKRAEVIPLLKKLGVAIPMVKGAKAQEKVAVAKDTEEFVRWVMSTQSPMSSSDVQSFVERQLGIKTSPPVQKRSGPRFQRGDSVLINAAKHKASKYDRGNYDRFDGKVGTVVEVSGNDALVSFKGETAPVRFPGAQEARGVGIYKYTKPYEVKGSAKIEMIYDAGGKSTPDAKIVVDAYLGRAKGTEKRAANYYTGHVVFASVGGNGWYFRGFPQQRMVVDPNSEAGYQARTFNPDLGKVVYIGVFGQRPSNWKEQLDKLDKVNEAQSAAG